MASQLQHVVGGTRFSAVPVEKLRLFSSGPKVLMKIDAARCIRSGADDAVPEISRKRREVALAGLFIHACGADDLR